jgi:dipeptidyl aminopeptidase/acylaminoacyl peptidase
MSTPFTIDRFLNVRSAFEPSFSPDGRFVSFLTNVTGVTQLWQVPVDGGWPVQLTFTHESVRGAWYSPRRHELVYSMDTGGDERTQLFRLTGVGGGTDHGLGDGWTSGELTQQPKAIHNFGGWSHDGQRIAFAANRDDQSRFDIYTQKLGEPTARLLHKGPGGYYLTRGWSPDDNRVLVYRMESNFNQDLYAIDVNVGEVFHLTPHQGDAQYENACWSADGKSVYCTSTAGGRDKSGLAQIDVATGKLTYIETPEHEVEKVLASPKGRWLAWLENAGGRSVLKLSDLKATRRAPPLKRKPMPISDNPWANLRIYEQLQTGKKVISPSLPPGVITQLEFARDDSKLAFAFDGPRHNLDVWVWDLHAHTLRQLTHASRAGIPFSTFTEPELIEYKTFDGRMIPAWWYPAKPRNGKLPPVIVYPHGGPESQTRPNFSAIFQFFLSRGYAILAPNVRGSSGYGTAFMNLDNTTKRMDSVNDLAHAAYWLRDQKKGDPKRLAVYGGSYGGFMVLAQVTHYPDLWAAGIDVVGICNFVTFLEKTGAYRRAHREQEYGNLREHREFLEKISPLNHVDKIKCPMMVIHGANDPRVPVHEAEQIVAALKKRGVPVEYLRYEDEGHGLAKLKNRLDAYPKMADFLDKYLK